MFRDIVKSGFSTLIVMALGIASGVLAARLLGPEGRGMLGEILFWPQFLVGIVALSLSDGIVLSSKSPSDKMVAAAGAATAALLLPIGLGIVLPVSVFVSYSDLEFSLFALAVGFAVTQTIAQFIDQTFQGIYRAENRFTALNVMRPALPALYVFMIIALWPTMGGLELFLWANIISIVMILLVKMALIYPTLNTPASLKTSLQLLRNSAVCHTSNVSTLIASQIDKLVAVFILSTTGFGFYVVSLSVAMPLQGIFSISISMVLLPVVHRLIENNAPIDVDEILSFVWSVTVLGTLLIVSFAPWGVPLVFGMQFSESGWLTSALCAAMMLHPLRTTLREVLRASQRHRHSIASDSIFIFGLLIFATGFSWETSLATIPVAIFLSSLASLSYLFFAARQNGLLPQRLNWLIPSPANSLKLAFRRPS